MSRPILAALLSCSACALTDEEKYLFAEYNPLGVTLFSRNLQDLNQVMSLVDDIKNVINRDDVLIAIDEEGGRVSRLKSFLPVNYVAAEDLGNHPQEYTQMHAALISADLRHLGVNVNYAPVVEKITVPQSPVLSSRCFSPNETQIVALAQTMIQTYAEMGVCPCIKHIPGHFQTQNDPHLCITQTNLSNDEIKKQSAYLKQLKNCPLAMTAHVILSAIDPQYPATLSKKVISEIIRSYLDYDGFLISDALEMHALEGNDIAKKTILGLEAGLDAVCYCAGKIEDLQAICREKRFMTEKSLIRFAKIKNIIHNTPKYVNVADVKKRYLAGLDGCSNVLYEPDATEVLF